jgi:hypothetical protein
VGRACSRGCLCRGRRLCSCLQMLKVYALRTYRSVLFSMQVNKWTDNRKGISTTQQCYQTSGAYHFWSLGHSQFKSSVTLFKSKAVGKQAARAHLEAALDWPLRGGRGALGRGGRFRVGAGAEAGRGAVRARPRTQRIQLRRRWALCLGRQRPAQRGSILWRVRAWQCAKSSLSCGSSLWFVYGSVSANMAFCSIEEKPMRSSKSAIGPLTCDRESLDGQVMY